jgi:hypothetical protein
MRPAADSEARERLFERWVRELALPVRADPTEVTITRYVAAGVTDVLLVESPEPLPFSRDVTVAIERAVPAVVVAPGSIEEWIAELSFEVLEQIVPDPPAPFAAVRRIIRAVAGPTGRELQRYDLLPGPGVGLGMAMSWTDTLVGPAAASVHPSLQPGHVLLLDGTNHVIGGPYLDDPWSLPPIWLPVPARILGDGSERRALVIPIGTTPPGHTPFTSGAHRLTFSIDRPRWRSGTPTGTTNYRASHVISIDLP